MRLSMIILILISFNCKSESQSFSLTIDVDQTLLGNMNNEGKLYFFAVDNERGEPFQRTWPGSGSNIWVTSIAEWDPTKEIVLTDQTKWESTTNEPFEQLDDGPYFIQVLYYHDQRESRINSPGNLFSQVLKVNSLDGNHHFTLKNIIPDHQLIEHQHLKEIELKSEVLSEFWGKEMKIKAAVILPNSYFKNSNAKYPLRINIAGYGGRYTRANYLMREGSRFEQFWMDKTCPQMISLILDGEGPFGDCYQLDSDNSGPYGEMLTTELIPYVESKFRGIGDADSRYLDGCSTGGWVSLALQIYYPDYFNGCFSYSPDGVDFSRFQLIDIYKDENAFINEFGIERPVARTINGEPTITMRDFIQYENVLGKNGTYITSGGQFSAFTALYSPKGEDNLPSPLFDPFTGDINHAVAEHWKKYDLTRYVEENWSEIGPKLQGKLWIWMGDMDNFYLNMAMRSFDQMLNNQTMPKSDASIHFSPMQGHCWEFSHEEVVRQIGEKMKH